MTKQNKQTKPTSHSQMFLNKFACKHRDGMCTSREGQNVHCTFACMNIDVKYPHSHPFELYACLMQARGTSQRDAVY